VNGRHFLLQVEHRRRQLRDLLLIVPHLDEADPELVDDFVRPTVQADLITEYLQRKYPEETA
jgi:hypothetical protein